MCSRLAVPLFGRTMQCLRSTRSSVAFAGGGAGPVWLRCRWRAPCALSPDRFLCVLSGPSLFLCAQGGALVLCGCAEMRYGATCPDWRPGQRLVAGSVRYSGADAADFVTQGLSADLAEMPGDCSVELL